MRLELIATLNRLVDHTEEIFLRLARQCPQLLSEMSAGLNRSGELLQAVERGQEDGSDQTSGIAAEIAAARRQIQDGSDQFVRMQQADDQFFDQLDGAIQRLSDLESQIAEIKEDSIEMELVSLNAMTVALKAGPAGLAFSYITEELKRLSAQTIELTDEITRRGERLRTAFGAFRESLHETRDFQSRLFAGLREKLTASFDELNEGISSVAQTMSGIRGRSMQVETPLRAIMEEIQSQDIIKQSVEHVVISLNEVRELEGIESVEHKLDELAFFCQLPDLCGNVLDDVSESIRRSLTLFRQQADAARAIIAEVEQQREEFIASLSRDDQTDSMRARFAGASTLLESLLQDIDTSIQKKRGIAEQSASLMREVRAMEEDFHSFAGLITRFHSVDIASRIEVSKQEVLQRMSGTVEQMTTLTQKIDTDVDTALAITKDFIQSVSGSISNYQAVAMDEERFVLDFSASMRTRYQTLFAANSEFSEALAGFSLFTRRFLSLFTETAEDVLRLEQLIEDITRVKETLAEIKTAAERRMEPLLQEVGRSEWSVGSERLQRMIERFTIFTHKKHAGELGGFSVEQGAESGEITFF